MWKRVYVSPFSNIEEVKTKDVKVAVIGDDKPVPEGVFQVNEMPYMDVINLIACTEGVVWFVHEGEEI